MREDAEKKPVPTDPTSVEIAPPPRALLTSEKDAGKQASDSTNERSDSTASTVDGNDSSDVEAQLSDSDYEYKTPLPVKVDLSERRGLLARICLVAELKNARHFPRRTKWLLTAVVAFAAIAAPIGSAIILPSLADISEELHASKIVTNLSVALYMLAQGIFPLWWSFFSERSGRRSVYVCAFTLFVVFNILTAVSANIAMFIVMRMLAGGAAGSVQSVGAGTVADLWQPKERGKAMGMFYLGPLMGPLLSPIIGGALQIGWGWRATGWFMVIYGAVTLLIIIALLPETLQRKLPPIEPELVNDDDGDGPPLTRTTTRQTLQSVHKRTKAVARMVEVAFIEPLLVVKYLRFPPVALSVSYASVAFGSLYMLQTSIQATLGAAPYNFNSIEVGCAYLFNSVGYLLASYFAGPWNDRIMLREARRAGRFDPATREPAVRPEDRMRENAVLGALLYPAAMLWYGWAAARYAPWAVVLLPNLVFGIGLMIMFSIITTMLTEFMPGKASVGVALNNMARNTLACIFIFVTQPLLDAIGNGWLFTAVFVITLASGIVVVLFRKNSAKWRVAMDEALKNER